MARMRRSLGSSNEEGRSAWIEQYQYRFQFLQLPLSISYDSFMVTNNNMLETLISVLILRMKCILSGCRRGEMIQTNIKIKAWREQIWIHIQSGLCLCHMGDFTDP